MTSTTGYDQNLLASAPEVTGARRQVCTLSDYTLKSEPNAALVHRKATPPIS